MTLRREVHHGVKRMFLKQLGQQPCVLNVALHEGVPCVFFDVPEVGQIPGVRQCVQVDNAHPFVVPQQRANHM